MNRLLKTAVLVLLLAMVPFRAIAAATLADCAQTDTVQAQAAAPHTHDGKADCGACAEHCTSMLVVLSADGLSLPGDSRADRPAHGELLAAGFVPEHLDPPPLAG